MAWTCALCCGGQRAALPGKALTGNGLAAYLIEKITIPSIPRSDKDCKI